MQCVIITGSLQFNTMRTMGRHNWLNVLVKHKVVFSWSLLLPHNTSYCGQESASGMPCILVLIREGVVSGNMECAVCHVTQLHCTPLTM